MKKSNILLYVLAGVLGILVFIFFVVMFNDDVACFLSKSFGIKTEEGKKGTLQFLGWIISGFITFFGLFVFNRRAAALDKANELTEKGHALERFKVGIDQLSKKDSPLSHIASFHALYYLAKTRRKSYAHGTLDVLCVHLKQITKYEDFTDLHSVYDHPEEVKILTRILFGQETGKVFDGLDFDLKHANLTGIDFQGMKNPKEVNFSLAYLNKAVFDDVNLSDANFSGATLYESSFMRTNFQCANLRDTDFLCANLSRADFSGASMENAILYGTGCFMSNFYKARLYGADFCGAYLREAKNLETSALTEAKYNDKTEFPMGFKPEEHGMIYCPPDDKK